MPHNSRLVKALVLMMMNSKLMMDKADDELKATADDEPIALPTIAEHCTFTSAHYSTLNN